MEMFIVRYQDRHFRKTEFVQVVADSQENALRVFKNLIEDYVDDSPTVITKEEYREIRINCGLNPDGIDESEMTPQYKKLMEIATSKEWQEHYASGGYNDY